MGSATMRKAPAKPRMVKPVSRLRRQPGKDIWLMGGGEVIASFLDADADGKPEPVRVRLGISDGSETELVPEPDNTGSASLKEGTEVIVASKANTAAPAGGAARASSSGHMRPPF